MKRFIISFGWLMAACVAIAGTGTSNEFRLDCRTGVRTAALTEKIQYSTAWATNLTAAQQGEAKAVVKVNPCLKTPPKYLVVDMSGGRSAARWPVSYLDEVPSGGWTDEYKTEKLVLRYIPAGSFIMGGRATDYPGAVNTNPHMVTLTKPFYIGVFECTQRQWELAMGTRPSRFSNEACYATRPVERVSHSDIRGAVLGLQDPRLLRVDPGSFLGVLREKVGFAAFDLPTEAQWEFACRAGTTTALNSGKDIPSLEENDALNEVSRNCFNGGWIIDGEPIADDEQLKPYFSATDEFMTSRVGAYRGNDFGLYDMHGNVWEFVLDNVGCADSVDPLGWDESSATVGYCGGSFEQTWVGPYVSSSAGFLGEYDSTTSAVDRRHRNVGFRICLHNADFPILESAEVLVNASGASAVDWVPTQAGTYQLTHEVQMDGTTVAPMESALFKVEGPELEIVPMGELTNGVAVKVEVEGVGVGSGWQVYYTTDGSEPTAGSTKYEGPFALPASATVKAVAISPSGVSSEVASKELVLSPALAVEDVAARQRYPWNGKVDIDCEITGDATKKYAVTFSVEDEIGHTNLPIRTVGADVLGGPQLQNNENALDGGSGVPGGHALPFVLSPGKYRFVWDAAADLPKGTRFGGVSVSIDAEPSPLADWKRVVTISTDGYAGSETLTDVPVLVRLSSAIEGFDYADFAAPDTGADMIFTDMEGTARYPYEIDEWHKGGESLVWVKLPRMVSGTKFKMAYGNSQLITHNSQLSSHEVWRDYAGVWHMNEDSGTAYDSTAHGLDALPSFGTNTNIDVSSEMKAYEMGVCGRARQNEISEVNETKGCGNYLLTPSYDALGLGGRFIVSGWFRAEQVVNYPRMISRKYESSDKSGWEIHPRQNSSTNISVRGATGGSVICPTPEMKEAWVNITAIYSDAVFSCFTNGVLSLTGESVAATDNGLGLAFGCNPPGNENTWCGQYDEIRLRGGSLSADRIKADYDMIANRDFCTYGKVEAGPGAEPVPPTRVVTITFDPNGGELAGAATRVYKGNRVMFGELPEPTRTGYAFGGWSLTQDGTAKITSSDFVPDMDKVVFATWTAATYSVKFNANGGTGTMANESFTYGTAKALTANAFTRTGYTFDGWATSADGAKVYSDKEVVSNLATTQGAVVNLYAVWKGALYMVVDLSGGSTAKSYPVSYLDAVPSGGWTDTYKTTKLVLRRVPAGTNSAGGSMSKDMWVGVFELTQGQYKNISGDRYYDYGGLTPTKLTRNHLTSEDSVFSIGEVLSAISKKAAALSGARLPTQTEWEYACRAGTTTDYNNGTNASDANMKKVGCYYGNNSRFGNGRAPVGSFVANAWGLYDMHGNIEECVSDGAFYVGGDGHCICGGNYESSYQSCTSASVMGDGGWSGAGGGLRVFATVK